MISPLCGVDGAGKWEPKALIEVFYADSSLLEVTGLSVK